MIKKKKKKFPPIIFYLYLNKLSSPFNLNEKKIFFLFLFSFTCLYIYISIMPAQLSTILYISDYKERTSSDFFVGSALGYARLEEEGEAVQTFNITVFYPVDETKPCYVPKLSEGQVLSIANSKFSKGAKNNELDVSVQFL